MLFIYYRIFLYVTMFKRMEIAMTENLCPAELVLVVTLQDLHTKKAYRYLSLLMGFSRLFEQLDVRVFVCSRV